ncbi:MAG: nucleotidyltransferase domain-containing protein [Archaeoglobaceae archaeon]|nr:nucleotidyltransferase domain-containing protein [Archaeoglobaceae archaeon]
MNWVEIYLDEGGLMSDDIKVEKIRALKFYSKSYKEYMIKVLEKIKEYYGDQLVSLVIFGSYARKENRLSSDLDILIVLKANKPRCERIKEFVENIEMSLEYLTQKLIDEGISVDMSPLILSEKEAKYFNPIYLDMVEYLIIIVDKNNFIKNMLKEVREQIEEWGSYKEFVGNMWAWVIKKGEFVGGVKLG